MAWLDASGPGQKGLNPNPRVALPETGHGSRKRGTSYTTGRVIELGFWVLGLGFRVLGLGFRGNEKGILESCVSWEERIGLRATVPQSW